MKSRSRRARGREVDRGVIVTAARRHGQVRPSFSSSRSASPRSPQSRGRASWRATGGQARPLCRPRRPSPGSQVGCVSRISVRRHGSSTSAAATSPSRPSRPSLLSRLTRPGFLGHLVLPTCRGRWAAAAMSAAGAAAGSDRLLPRAATATRPHATTAGIPRVAAATAAKEAASLAGAAAESYHLLLRAVNGNTSCCRICRGRLMLRRRRRRLLLALSAGAAV